MGSANISFGYVEGTLVKDPAPLFVKSAGETLATSTTSAQSVNSAPASSARGGRSLSARVMLSQEGYVEIGANPTATNTTSMRCQANTEYYFGIHPGHKVAIRDTA